MVEILTNLISAGPVRRMLGRSKHVGRAYLYSYSYRVLIDS